MWKKKKPLKEFHIYFSLGELMPLLYEDVFAINIDAGKRKQLADPYYVITATVDKTIVSPGEQIVFTGQVSELVSVEPWTLKPVASAWVRLFLLEAGVTTEIGTGTYTDENGYFTIACAAPMENGSYTYMVMAYFGADSAVAYVNVTVTPTPPPPPDRNVIPIVAGIALIAVVAYAGYKLATRKPR